MMHHWEIVDINLAFDCNKIAYLLKYWYLNIAQIKFNLGIRQEIIKNAVAFQYFLILSVQYFSKETFIKLLIIWHNLLALIFGRNRRY